LNIGSHIFLPFISVLFQEKEFGHGPACHPPANAWYSGQLQCRHLPANATYGMHFDMLAFLALAGRYVALAGRLPCVPALDLPGGPGAGRRVCVPKKIFLKPPQCIQCRRRTGKTYLFAGSFGGHLPGL